ncbi:asparagine synthetase B family protein [Niveibacterium terrae]|uniref:asparagine synthetase B family protein n=1 Tax=Niveibacterium terrae TaxID=3373598 RepID=UPI003A8DD650
MSERINILRGSFDPGILDIRTGFAATASASLRIDRPGLDLEAEGPDQRFVVTERALLVLTGRPHSADPTLSPALASEAPRALLERLRAEPDATLAMLDGRFSALWIDLDRASLNLACDRFSTHSLCWARVGQLTAFANRADAVPLARRSIDPQAIFDYLYFHVIPAPRTIFRGVERLAPGLRLCATATDAHTSSWWRATFAPRPVEDLEELKSRFRTAVRAAVAREAEEPGVAAFLSGGTDSSTVVGMLREVTESRPRCYSMGFDADGYDEIAYARIAARAFDADHREYYVSAQDLVANIPLVAAHYDQPFGNSSALPAFCLARLAHDDGYGKLLAGDGGDELFGGNTRYAKQKIFSAYQSIPAPLRHLVLDPLSRSAAAARTPGLSKIRSYVEQANIPLPDRTEQYNLLFRLGLEEVLSPTLRAKSDAAAPMRLQRAVWDAVIADNDIDRHLGFDWRFTLADNDLPKVTGTTELAGLSVGFPLLANSLQDIATSLPSSLKVRGQSLRWFFKQALADFLPGEILAKKKHGFGLPFGQWVLKDKALGTLARASVEGLTERGILRQAFVGKLFAELLPAHPGYYGEMVWISMMLEQWLRAHAPEYRL